MAAVRRRPAWHCALDMPPYFARPSAHLRNLTRTEAIDIKFRSLCVMQQSFLAIVMLGDGDGVMVISAAHLADEIGGRQCSRNGSL